MSECGEGFDCTMFGLWRGDGHWGLDISRFSSAYLDSALYKTYSGLGVLKMEGSASRLDDVLV